jgi:hypothetical protein
MSESASVEGLSAEVRVLQVDNRQVTRSMYRQLDEAALERFEPFGRVRDNEGNPREGMLQLVGRDTAAGTLVRYDAYPPDWFREGPSDFAHWVLHNRKFGPPPSLPSCRKPRRSPHVLDRNGGRSLPTDLERDLSLHEVDIYPPVGPIRQARLTGSLFGRFVQEIRSGKGVRRDSGIPPPHGQLVGSQGRYGGWFVGLFPSSNFIFQRESFFVAQFGSFGEAFVLVGHAAALLHVIASSAGVAVQRS